MDPFEDFEEILVQSRLKFTNSQPKLQLDRQNRPRTASWRTSLAAVVEPKTTTQQVPATTVLDRLNSKQRNDTNNIDLATQSKQAPPSEVGDSPREEREESKKETRRGVASGLIENTPLSSYPTTNQGSKQLERVEQLETVSEVSEELSVEWHDEEQSVEKLSLDNDSASPSGSDKSELKITNERGKKSEGHVGSVAEEEGPEGREREAESINGRLEIGDESVVGKRGELLQLEDLVNLVSVLESSQSESPQTDGELSRLDSAEEEEEVDVGSESSRGRRENDYIGSNMRSRSKLPEENKILPEDSAENELKTRKADENTLKLIENKLESKFHSFGDDLIRLLQEQFSLLMNSISEHIERIESSLLPIRKWNQGEDSREETIRTRGFKANCELQKNGDGKTEHSREREAKFDLVDGHDKLKIAQESCSQTINENYQDDRRSSLGIGKHQEKGSKSAQVEKRLQNEIEKENEQEFKPLLEYYERRLRKYNGIILIDSICPKIPELSCSELKPSFKNIEMQTGTRNRWRGKQYELADTCYPTSKFYFNANSLLVESRFASRQLENRRNLLLKSIKQTQELPSKTYLQVDRPEVSGTS